MIQRILAQAVAVTLGIAMLLQVGCAGRSKSSSFYVLSPVGRMENEKNMDLNDMGDITI